MDDLDNAEANARIRLKASVAIYKPVVDREYDVLVNSVPSFSQLEDQF